MYLLFRLYSIQKEIHMFYVTEIMWATENNIVIDYTDMKRVYSLN